MARRSIARNAFMKVRSTSIRATSPANEKVPSKIYRLLARIGASVGIFCTPIVFFDTIGYPASVVGTSMEPTLEGSDSRWWKRDIVWLSRWGLRSPQIGQVFTFVSPVEPDKQHIKRVTACEGDIIRPRKGPAFLSIPEGCCWMESDNPKNSKDSNIYGPVEQFKTSFCFRNYRLIERQS
ncbi:unnamed protein product [Toxocara canis]|uniref:Mitochondrial inner membrane protease subunit 2 n=1 Tax=Toxocara canis TaxID=6265 RepID=A0A183U3H3_TOXCA|nr:unnamed protein product [Toxocara canis]